MKGKNLNRRKKLHPNRKPLSKLLSQQDHELLTEQYWRLLCQLDELQAQIDQLRERETFGVSPSEIFNLDILKN